MITAYNFIMTSSIGIILSDNAVNNLTVFVMSRLSPMLQDKMRWMIRFTLSYLILSYPVLSYLILSYLIVSYRILSYPILSYRILSYLILSCLIVSYYILSYLILLYLILSNLIVSYLIVSYLIVSYLILLLRRISYYNWLKLTMLFYKSHHFNISVHFSCLFRWNQCFEISDSGSKTRTWKLPHNVQSTYPSCVLYCTELDYIVRFGLDSTLPLSSRLHQIQLKLLFITQHFSFCLVLSCLVSSCLVLSCFILSYLILSYSILCYPPLSYRILTHPILFSLSRSLLCRVVL